MGWGLVAWLALLGMPSQTGKPVIVVYDAVCGREAWKCAMNIQSKGLKPIFTPPENRLPSEQAKALGCRREGWCLLWTRLPCVLDC